MSCRTCSLYEQMGYGQHCPCTHIEGRCMTNDKMELQGKAPNPFKPVRTHDDGKGDAVSRDTATTPEGESLTRQEYKDDSDVNTILRKFGVDAPIRSQPVFGQEVDYTLDLQQALGAIEQAKRANAQVPEELREKYPTWKHVLDAAETGEYQKDLEELRTKKDDAKREADRTARRAAMEQEEGIRRDIEAERAAAAVRAAPPDKTPKS